MTEINKENCRQRTNVSLD